MAAPTPQPEWIRVGDWRLDSRRHTLTRRGEETHLEPRLSSLLEFFARHPDTVLSKEEILDGVWGTRFVADSALTRAVAELRRALGDDAQSPTYIETISKRGYRLLAPVRFERRRAAAVRVTRLGAVAVVVALVAISVTVGKRLVRTGTAPDPTSRSIAVLPLVDLSAADGEEYFAESMTDLLITDLTRLTTLQVTSRRSVERFRESASSSAEIAAALGVDTLLEGTVLRSDGRVRIALQLIDARRDTHLWAESYERETSDVLALQAEVARAVAGEVHASLRPRLAEDRPKVDPVAHDLYLQGRYHLNRAEYEGPNRAPELFRLALEADPAYAPAYSGLADYYNLLCEAQHVPIAEAYPQAKAAALRALELDADLAEAHVSLATVLYRYEWDWEGARRHFARAIEFAPSDSGIAAKYSFFLTCLGRFGEAAELARRAVEADPLSAAPRTNLGWVYWNAGLYERSLEVLPDARTRDGSSAGLLYASWSEAFAGRFDQALELMEALGEEGDTTVLAATRIWIQARAGRIDEARALLAELEARAARDQVDPYIVAVARAGLGDEEGVFASLEEALEARSPNLVFLRVEPFFADLRKDPRYLELVRSVGLDTVE